MAQRRKDASNPFFNPINASNAMNARNVFNSMTLRLYDTTTLRLVFDATTLGPVFQTQCRPYSSLILYLLERATSSLLHLSFARRPLSMFSLTEGIMPGSLVSMAISNILKPSSSEVDP